MNVVRESTNYKRELISVPLIVTGCLSVCVCVCVRQRESETEMGRGVDENR